jgi:hypothetical protein
MPELSGSPWGQSLEPLVMADCSPSLLSRRQMESPEREIPHPASYFAQNLLDSACRMWHGAGITHGPSPGTNNEVYIKVGLLCLFLPSNWVLVTR